MFKGYVPASFIWRRSRSPPDLSQIRPVPGFKELLCHVVTGIRASTAFLAVAEISAAMVFVEIRIEDIEERIGWQVLTNPEVPVGFDIEK